MIFDQSFLAARFAGETPGALDMFPAREAKDVGPAIDRVLTVAANAEPARLVARSMKQKKSAAYLYQFTRRPNTKLAHDLGVHHGADLAYVFGNMNLLDGYVDQDRQLSQKMMAYWVNFARTGNPNGQDLPVWPVYQSQTDSNLGFSDTIHTNQNLFKNECDFIGRMREVRK
jgi:para-nitrobenzyl esterase